MRTFLYRIWQWTWGLLQTLLGLVLFLIHHRDRHFTYHGAIVTVWQASSSVSLGLFVFMRSDPYVRRFQGRFPADELFHRLLVHEYGHTVQSLLLGPLYLPLIGLPSAWWATRGGRLRRERGLPYSAFPTESWANRLGERVTGEKSIEGLV